MVLVSLKKQEKNISQVEFPAATGVDKIIETLVQITNQRSRLEQLVSSITDLVEYGPIKPYMEQGLTPEQLENKTVEKYETTVNGMPVLMSLDPTGRRTGFAPITAMADKINDVVQQAKYLLEGNALINDYENIFELFKGVLMIVFPMGLPEDDPVQMIMDDKVDKIESTNSSLWWAGKEMIANKILSDYVGRNEKTKIIVKLQKKGQGPPVREPPIDEKTQKEMMAFFYKKQEEHKKLMENEQDDYLTSSWANPKNLKNHFQGLSGITWRPGK